MSLPVPTGKERWSMSGAEEAKQMLRMSGKDLSALKGMLEVETFSEEIFGFHAQQAVEKALKAWIHFLEQNILSNMTCASW